MPNKLAWQVMFRNGFDPPTRLDRDPCHLKLTVDLWLAGGTQKDPVYTQVIGPRVHEILVPRLREWTKADMGNDPDIKRFRDVRRQMAELKKAIDMNDARRTEVLAQKQQGILASEPGLGKRILGWDAEVANLDGKLTADKAERGALEGAMQGVRAAAVRATERIAGMAMAKLRVELGERHKAGWKAFVEAHGDELSQLVAEQEAFQSSFTTAFTRGHTADLLDAPDPEPTPPPKKQKPDPESSAA